MSVSPFSVLTAMSSATASVTQNQQLAMISQDLQNQLNRQLAAIQAPTDPVTVNASKQQLAALQAQQTSVSKFETLFGNNNSLYADMTTQLTLMTKAVTNNDSSGFDNALSALNTDLTDVTVPTWNPLFQNDGVAQLKNNGITIQSSASYDLSTTAGQNAATADITTLQNTLTSIMKVNGNNQTVAASELTAVTGKLTALQTYQSNLANAQSQAVAQQTQTLTQNMQNQLHLIELNLGQTNQASAMLNTMLNPPSPQTSVFGALASAVGQTAKGAETALGNTPILSLFA
jgi:hypothetical protein